MEDDCVELFVFGMKSILKNPVLKRVNMDSTWYDFLNKKCTVRLGPEDNVMAATTSYSPGKRGWSADLSEKIRTFVEKFAIKKDRYSVRLMMKLPPNQTQRARDTPRQSQPNSNLQAQVRPLVNSSNRTLNCHVTNGQSRTSIRRTTFNTQHRVPFSVDTPAERNRRPRDAPDAQNNSIVPSQTGRRMGVVRGSLRLNTADANSNLNQSSRHNSRLSREEIKQIVKERIGRFSNAYLLRVHDEIKKLQDNNLWDRNVLHAPMTSYFSQELFMG